MTKRERLDEMAAAMRQKHRRRERRYCRDCVRCGIRFAVGVLADGNLSKRRFCCWCLRSTANATKQENQA